MAFSFRMLLNPFHPNYYYQDKSFLRSTMDLLFLQILRDIKTGIGLRKEISSRVLETIHYNDAIRVLQGLEDVNEIQDYKTMPTKYRHHFEVP